MKNQDSLAGLLALGFEEGTSNEGELDFSDIPDGDWRLGGYELLEEIGRGGMGIIYKARQQHSNRLVALKRLRPIEGNEAVGMATAARLHREAAAVASLDHPHILPIYEVGLGNDGLPFFSMKLAVGGSLAEIPKPVDKRQAVTWLLKVARAVQYAHGCGILHRDLKPANILLDAQSEPLVADFGLAKWLDRPSDITQSLAVFGTPGYLAPEQALGRKVGFQTDLYSMGAILFELLTGRLPFIGENAWSVVKEASEVKAPRLREFLPGIDRDLETICSRCLEREMEARYRAAGDLGDDLQRWLDGRPIIARPITVGETAWRWTIRHPVFAIFSMVALFLVVALVIQGNKKQKIADTLHRQEKSAHSLVILPFLDLDNTFPERVLPTVLENQIAGPMSRLGPCEVTVLSKSSSEWTGAGTSREIIAATRTTGARYAMTGVYRAYRNQPGKVPVTTVFLVKNDGQTVLGKWQWETPSHNFFLNESVAREIYKILGSDEDQKQVLDVDATQNNPVAASYLKVGDDLMQRRNLADADRALACFESAIREAPDSILARSYLALATMGRQSMSPDPAIWARGIRAAQEALALQPDNPAANRAYGVLLGMQGDYRGELEHYLKAISCGYESERALGQIGYPYLMLGRPDIALLWYAKARESAEHPAEWDAYIGDCLALLGRYQEAGEAYHSASEFHPELAEGWVGMCRLLLRQKKFAEAEALYLTKKDTFLNSPEGLRLGALIAFFNRDFTKAQPLIQELSLQPHVGNGSFGAMDWRVALARLDTTSPELRERLLQESFSSELEQIARFPSDGEAHYRLGAAYAVAHRNAAALACLKSALANGWLDNVCLELDPRWDSVRQEPEFKKFLWQLTPDKMIRLVTSAHPIAENKQPLIKP